jgi:hypothetical protein
VCSQPLSAPAEQVWYYRVRVGDQFVQVCGQKVASLNNYFSSDHGHIHVAALYHVDKVVVQVAVGASQQRRHAGRIGTGGDQVGLLADLNGTDLSLQSEGAGSVGDRREK